MMHRSIHLPGSRGLLGLLAAAAIGLTLSATSASGSSAVTTPDEERELEIVAAAVTPTPEMLFVPVTPCRVLDTRETAAGDFDPGQTRNYYTSGTVGFEAQGGKSGGCGIPTGAKAVSLVMSAIDPTDDGYLRAWAAGTSEPQATLLNYNDSRISVGSPIPVRSGAGTDLSVKNYNGSTHLVIDVNGYYIQQMQAYISASGTVLDQSGRLVSATRTSEGIYSLVWDRNISNCTGQGSSDLTGHIVSVYTSGTTATVRSVTNAGAYNDYYLNVLITC
jgi:hypothetical protein